MMNNILLFAYDIWLYLVLITSIKILLLLLYPRVSRIQLKIKVGCVLDRGVLGKLEVALGQQKSAQAWPAVGKIRDLCKIFRFY
jgi:hypothetical protein